MASLLRFPVTASVVQNNPQIRHIAKKSIDGCCRQA
jgi:hypothetical protein